MDEMTRDFNTIHQSLTRTLDELLLRSGRLDAIHAQSQTLATDTRQLHHVIIISSHSGWRQQRRIKMIAAFMVIMMICCMFWWFQ